MVIGHGLPALRHLSRLELTVTNPELYADELPYLQLKLDVGWAALTSLQQLVIHSDSVQCQQNMLQIMVIKSLRVIEFRKLHTVDVSSSRLFVALLHGLAKGRHDVRVRLKGDDLSKTALLISG